jgi:hypothetical protein
MRLDGQAMQVAIDLVHFPGRVRYARSAPLPQGIDVVLGIAARDPDSLEQALAATGRTAENLERAAGFFIEQVLLAPEADSYRVLGANIDAPSTLLRRNMALLLRYLHPDVEVEGNRSIFAARVTAAWDNLKTADRRIAYDSGLEKRVADFDVERRRVRSMAQRGRGQSRISQQVQGRSLQGATSADVSAKKPGLLKRALALLSTRPRQ